MDISGLFIRVIILVTPGIVASRLYRKLTGRPTRPTWEDFCEIILFSMLSYVVLGACTSLAHRSLAGLVFFQALLDEKITINWWEIGKASICAIVVTFLAAWAHQYNWLTWIGRKIRLTKRLNDNDVWQGFHNKGREARWLFVRDHKLGLVYYGWIEQFSESDRERELLMREVEVYSAFSDGSDDSGENAGRCMRLYKAESIYFCRERYDLTLEIPSASEDTSDGI